MKQGKKHQETSPKTKGAMSSGQSFNQTCKLSPTLARLAKASTTLLHNRGTKQKSKKDKRETWAKIHQLCDHTRIGWLIPER